MEEKQLTFTVSMEDANTIVAALGELPAKVSMALIQKLQVQAAPQIKTEEQPQES